MTARLPTPSTCCKIRTFDGSRSYSDADEQKPQETVELTYLFQNHQPILVDVGVAVRGTDRTIVARNWLLELLNPFVQQLLTTFSRTVVTVWQTGQADVESVAANTSLRSLIRSGKVICDGLFSAIGLSSLCRTKRCQSSRHPEDLFDRRSDPILSATGVPSESKRRCED